MTDTYICDVQVKDKPEHPVHQGPSAYKVDVGDADEDVLENVPGSWDSPKIRVMNLKVHPLNQGSSEYWTFYKKTKLLHGSPWSPQEA